MGERGKHMLKISLEIRKNVYGEDHYLVATTVAALSNSYRSLGDLQEAKKMAEYAFSMLSNTFPRK